VEEAWPVNVRYIRRALVQIDEALSYIEARSPEGATHVRDRVLALISLIEKRPYAGRATSRRNVRRVSANPYPYLIDYRVNETEIVILRFRHSARRPLDP
jgi:plasmid stabilization system protein ParE